MNSIGFIPRPFSRSGLRISFRDAVDNDAQFIDRLTESVMKEYVYQVWGEGTEYFNTYREINKLDSKNTHIITHDGNDIGRLAVTAADDKTIRLFNIQLLPQYHNKGIGTDIIQQLISFADKKGKDLELLVLEVNPAKRLYEKLGFSEYGIEDHRIKMRRSFQENKVKCFSF